MPLSIDLKNEYYRLLKACLTTLKKNEDYKAVCNEYLKLKKKLDGVLENKDSVCVDSERLIDKSTGKIKPSAEFIIEGDPRFVEMLAELGELYLKKKEFEESGSVGNVYVVLDISRYEECEKKIIENLGLYDGRRAICEIKKSILPLEKEMGLDFFQQEVIRLEDLLKIMFLYPLSAPVKITKEESWKVESVLLMNGQGECFNFEKSAQIHCSGGVYLELELLDDLKVGKFNYYRVESLQESQKFTLVEDIDFIKRLDTLREKLLVKLKIE